MVGRDKKQDGGSGPVGAGFWHRGMVAKVAWAWHLLVRNRLAIAVASLLWLLFRSGSQPRRLSYPCQQVAAANVGVFVAGLIPVLFLSRRRRGRRPLPLAVVVRRQLVIAGLMFVVALVGIEGFQYAQSGTLQATLPTVPPPPTEPEGAVVSLVQVQRSTTTSFGNPKYHVYTPAEIDAMVEKAVELAGGLDQIMEDKDEDGEILVVLKPNLVSDYPYSTMRENGAVTDPNVMASLVRLVKEAGLRSGKTTIVKIAEGSASGYPWPGGHLARTITKNAYIQCGYTTDPITGPQNFAYDSSVELVDLNDAGGLIPPGTPDLNKVAWVELGDPAVMRSTYLAPKILLECDVLISVPTLKNHTNADVTLSLKNRIGCAPSDMYHARDEHEWGHGNQMKLALHFDNDGFDWDIDNRASGYYYPPEVHGDSYQNLFVHYTIVDLNLIRPQDFALIDGLVGITDGPAPNDPFAYQPHPCMSMILAGVDSVAVDTVATLVMGYDPQYVQYLRWAYNRELGTMKTSRITVKGDSVASTRLFFGLADPPKNPPLNRSEAETNPPTLASADIPSPMIGTVQVEGSGFTDDVGVVKAELRVRKAQGPNLVFNGDFETGLVGQGWTTWRAESWGTNESWDFISQEPGHLGDRCLRLGSETTHSSFGVYQQVTVEPGKTYRLDAYWKGKKLHDAGDGFDNWFELLLIDGPWDPAKGDSANPATIVESNYMYAYDQATWGLKGPVGTTFGWIWAHEQNSPPAYQVDWNNRRGERTATGTTMTVVLKAGTVGTGVACWFDNVTLREVGEPEFIDSVENPTDPFTLEWNTLNHEDGDYEVTVTVFDAALNEASITETVEVFNAGTFPVIKVSTNAISTITQVGVPPEDDTFTVRNIGIGTLNYRIDDDADWLSVLPVSGDSTGSTDEDTIAVSYDITGLVRGTYHATISVSDNGSIPDPAYNSPVKIAVTLEVETVLPDFDGDGDVDMEDHGHIQACFSGGEGSTYGPGCEDADLNGDYDVDRYDESGFLGCLSGANVLADPLCLP